MNMGIQSTQKVWKAGQTLSISVPKKVCAILGIEEGDYLQVDWAEVIKQSDLKGEDVKKRIRKENIVKNNKIIKKESEK